LADGRSRHVPAQSVEALAIPAVDGWPHLHIDAADISQSLVGRVELAHRVGDLARLLAGRCSQ
jgi:hypothetical protein